MNSARSAAGLTVVVVTAVLSAGLISWPFPNTVALLVTGPATVVVATMVIVACPLAARLPKSHVTTPPEKLQLPWLLVAETKARVAGRVLVTLTPLATVARVAVVTLVVVRFVTTIV